MYDGWGCGFPGIDPWYGTFPGLGYLQSRLEAPKYGKPV